MYATATGMVSPVGLSSESACAAMRAGLCGFAELPYLDNGHRPIAGACVPGLDLGLRRSQRIVSLLGMALFDLLAKCPDLQTHEIPLLVGLCAPDRPGGGRVDDPIIASVQEALGVRFDPRLSSTIFRGHVAGFVGLDLARQLLRNSPRSACIVSGVDSNINAATLRWLEASGRLKLDENSNGLVPGEGAAAVLVRAAPSGDSVLEVAGLGFAMESAGVTSVEPFLGHGLAEAARSALREADEPLSRMDFRLSDATGETYGFKEQSLTLSRVLRGGPSAMPLWHCADAVGDVGAASGVFQLVRAFEAFRKGYAPGSRAIGFTSNVKGERAAVVLRWRGAGLPH